MNTKILDLSEKIIKAFEKCFSRQAAWSWFAILVIGFMLRSDKLGITSVVRDLKLPSNAYNGLTHFFRASSWSLAEIRTCWFETVRKEAKLHKVNGRCILVGDGTKHSKEGRRMPGVKRLHQESEDSSKAEYIYGHMWGGLGVLSENKGQFVCIPLSIQLHDGLRETENWLGESAVRTGSHVVRTIEDASDAALVFGNTYLTLDRYYLTRDALEKLAELNEDRPARVDIVTRAKMNCVAYEKPGPKKPGRGRPRKKGASVHLAQLFDTQYAKFRKGYVMAYGKRKRVRWLCVNLLWGQQLYQELRFVLVEMDGKKCILVSTDLELDPVEIIQLYSRRFSIECLFKELKQETGAFSYRFWSKHMPKLSHFKKKGDPGPLEQVTDEHSRMKVLDAAEAIEMHMMIACIAIGILQILSIDLIGQIDPAQIRYLRTPSRGRVSEASLMEWMRRNFLPLLFERPESPLTQLILKAQTKSRC